jgi:hypothetical protein
VQRSAVTIDFLGKIAMGDMHQVLNINGATNVLRPNGSTTVLKGGLLALRSNIGSHERDELAFVPEVGVNIGLHLTRRLKARVGYSFLWVSRVARAGEQIDPVVNVTQFPTIGQWAACRTGPAHIEIRRDRFLGSWVELRLGSKLLIHRKKVYRTPIVAGYRRSLRSTNTQSKLISALIGKSPTAQSLNLFADKNENAGRERHNV